MEAFEVDTFTISTGFFESTKKKGISIFDREIKIINHKIARFCCNHPFIFATDHIKKIALHRRIRLEKLHLLVYLDFVLLK